MLTALGKYLRKARVDRGVSLREMADRLEISPALLSSIETGKRDLKPSVVDSIINYLELSGHELESFKQTVDASVQEIKMTLRELDSSDEESRRAGVFLARNFQHLSQEARENINKLVKKELETMKQKIN